MRCPEFANIDGLLDQLKARWLSAIDMGAQHPLGEYKQIFRIAFVPTLSGMQFLLATIQDARYAQAAQGIYFAPEARDELKTRIAQLIENIEARDFVAPSREESDPALDRGAGFEHHLYAISSEERKHSAR
jgi:hypothetical protein